MDREAHGGRKELDTMERAHTYVHHTDACYVHIHATE